MNVLLGLTGSVATTIAGKIVHALGDSGASVRVVATQRAGFFADLSTLDVPVYLDSDEWSGVRYVQGKPVLHIELRKWADVLLIAPLTANTLAKLAHGVADNLLKSVVRAWDREKPLLVAPAMNTLMWEHPATQEHLATLARWYQLTVVPPIEKVLACGDRGTGAMADIGDIVRATNVARVL